MPPPVAADDEALDKSAIFTCSVLNVRTLVTVLKAVSFKQKALCCITPHGLKFTIEDSKSVQALAYLQSALFHTYNYALPTDANPNGINIAPSSFRFLVSLETLLDCLTIFGGWDDKRPGVPVTTGLETSAHLSLSRDLSELVITLREEDIVTVCRLSTYEPEEMSELEEQFQSVSTMNKLIMNSEWIKDALSEVDSNSEKLTILVSPNEPYFRLSAKSSSGETQMDYPKNTDILESFQCRETASFSYKYSLILPMLKALSLSRKVNLRMNQLGVLNVQLMIPLDETHNGFVEFLWPCLIED